MCSRALHTKIGLIVQKDAYRWICPTQRCASIVRSTNQLTENVTGKQEAMIVTGMRKEVQCRRASVDSATYKVAAQFLICNRCTPPPWNPERQESAPISRDCTMDGQELWVASPPHPVWKHNQTYTQKSVSSIQIYYISTKFSWFSNEISLAQWNIQ